MQRAVMRHYRGTFPVRTGSVGHERAREHIRQARALSAELGGADEDVKRYLFSLSGERLQELLERYEARYGRPAREYAEKTLPAWRSGRVHMSGMVAERLFSLLPPAMPLEAKLRLVESLWRHVGPASRKRFYVGVDADLGEVSRKVRAHLEEVVTSYRIPPAMEARFQWLAGGDARVKQQLLNHLRQQEKRLLCEALRLRLPILLAHLRSEKGRLTTRAVQVLRVGKHEVELVVTDRVSGVSETAPPGPATEGGLDWVWLGLGVVVVLWLLGVF